MPPFLTSEQVTAWTYFDLPEPSVTKQQITDGIRPLLAAPGYRRSAVGKLLDTSRPRAVVLSTWNSLRSFRSFAASPAAATVASNLARFTGADPHSVTTTTASLWPPLDRPAAMLSARTQFRRVFFPVRTQARPDARQELLGSLRSLVSPHGQAGLGAAASSVNGPYRARPAKGWVLEAGPSDRLAGEDGGATADGPGVLAVEEYAGQECVTLMVVMFWRSAEEEQGFLGAARVARTVPGPEGTSILVGTVPVLEDWEEHLRERGARGWADEYATFEII